MQGLKQVVVARGSHPSLYCIFASRATAHAASMQHHEQAHCSTMRCATTNEHRLATVFQDVRADSGLGSKLPPLRSPNPTVKAESGRVLCLVPHILITHLQSQAVKNGTFRGFWNPKHQNLLLQRYFHLHLHM